MTPTPEIAEEVEEFVDENDLPVYEPTEEDLPVYEESTEEIPVAVETTDKLPHSSDKKIKANQLDGMSAEDIRIARNEIYARHGLIFQSEDLQEYFSAQPWYKGTVDDASKIKLTELEQQNIKTITDYEKAHNINQ
jgi:hypothetical protein